MKSKINKQMWLEILITTIFLFSMELIFKVVEKFNIFSYATIRIFLSSFLIVLLSNFLFSFIKSNQKRRICNLILLAIASIYAAAQAGFLNFIGIYMSFGTTSQIGAVTSYIIDFIESFKIEYYTIFFPLILYAIYVFIPNKRELLNEETNLFKTRIRMTSIFIVTSCLYYATLLIPFMQNDLQLITNIDLFHFPSNSSIAVNQFGPVMYGMLDIKNVILPYQDLGYSGNNNNQSTTDEPNQRHFDDTNWEKLNTNTKNTSFKNLNQYFLHRKISPKNEYTGKLKDKNVIVLMLESVNNVILNEEYFPNFARMKKIVGSGIIIIVQEILVQLLIMK